MRSTTGPAVFTVSVSVPVNYWCIPHRHVGSSDDGALVRGVGCGGWGYGGLLSKRFLHLDWTHPPTASTQGTGFHALNLVAKGT